MNLTNKQKKYLKKNIKLLPLSTIAEEIGVEEKLLYKYLESRWGEEKVKKYLSSTQKGNESPKNQLNLKKWIIKNKYYLILLTILVLGAYLNSLPNEFVSDDIATIRDFKEIGNLRAYYHNIYDISLERIFHFLIYKIFGLVPAYYRLLNILSHLLSTYTLFFLLGLLYTTPISLIAAAIFAVHPLLTEGVTWISGCPYSQSTFLIFLSFTLYLLARRNNFPKKQYYASLILGTLAFFVSQKTIIYPFFILSYELFLGNLKQNWKKIGVYFIPTIAFFLILIKGVSIRTNTLSQNYYQDPGTNNPLIQIPVAISSYIELFFWPKALTLYHSEVAITSVNYAVQLAVFLIFTALALISIRHRKDIIFWLSIFIISLLPTLTPLKISWIVAERYVYLGVIGLIVPTVLIIQTINTRYLKNSRFLYIFFGLIVIALFCRTFARNLDWRNQDTLWVAAAKYSPSSHQNHNNLGDMYARHGEYEKAIQEFQTAVNLKPNYGDAYHNMANVYWQIGKIDEAVFYYQKALVYNPNLWQSHQNLAAIYFEGKQPERSQKELETAVLIAPDNPDLYTNLGIVYSALNEKDKATAAFQKALSLNANDERAKNGLISLFKQTGVGETTK